MNFLNVRHCLLYFPFLVPHVALVYVYVHAHAHANAYVHAYFNVTFIHVHVHDVFTHGAICVCFYAGLHVRFHSNVYVFLFSQQEAINYQLYLFYLFSQHGGRLARQLLHWLQTPHHIILPLDVTLIFHLVYYFLHAILRVRYEHLLIIIDCGEHDQAVLM